MFKTWSLVGIINMHELLGEESIKCESHFKQTHQLTPDFKFFQKCETKMVLKLENVPAELLSALRENK